jgi:hypothetical protein
VSSAEAAECTAGARKVCEAARGLRNGPEFKIKYMF